MKRYKLAAWISAFWIAASLPADAQIRNLDPVIPGFEEPAPSFIKVGQAGFTFLALPTNARSAAMADAGVGATGHASSLFTNPATLAFFEGREVFGTHVEWIADTRSDVLGAAFNLSGYGTVGVGFVTFDAGTFNRTEIDPNPAGAGYKELGTFKTTNYAALAGYGYKITDRFSIGASVKFAHQDLGQGKVLIGGNQVTVSNSKSAFAVDLGTYFNTGFRNTVLAMTVQNFSQEIEYQREQFELPRNIRLGVLVDLLAMSGGTPVPHHLNLALDFTNPVDFDERVLFGLEYTFQQAGSPIGFSGRGGYKANHDTESFSAGGGIRYRTESGRGVKVDYAYKRFDSNFFTAVHMVSAALAF